MNMPKLKRRRHGARQIARKSFSSAASTFKFGGKLKQHRTQLACSRQRFNGRQKSRHKIFGRPSAA